MSEDYNASVVKNDRLSDSLCLLTIKPDFEIRDFKAGQFTTLGLKLTRTENDSENVKLVRKAYSIASSPIQNKYLEFYIARVVDGELTPHLFDLEPGDRVCVGEKITGAFTLDDIPENKHLLMISTGTGLAPFLSMIRTHMICGHTRHFVVLHGARFSYELGFYSELSVMSLNCKNFHYIPCVSRAEKDTNWGGAKGRVTAVIKTRVIEKVSGIRLIPDNFEILLCGNPKMVTEIMEYLQELGFKEDTKKQSGEIHIEKYW